tara:strand:+ start:25003 stop:25635 length:633 start_codon:yes stop_codon:yes gene_type:complete
MAPKDTDKTCPKPLGSRGRGRPRDPALAAKVFVTTLGMLADLGYQRLSMECIAARTGVAKTTLYRRWPNKEELVIAAVLSSRRLPPEPQDSGSLRADLVTLLETLAGGQSPDGRRLAMTTLTNAMRATPRLGDLIRKEFVAVMRHHVDVAFQNAITRGELPAHAILPPFFADIAPSMMATRLLIAGEAVDNEFRDQLIDELLLPILHQAS